MNRIVYVWALLVSVIAASAATQITPINIRQFGAQGDGSDDSAAIARAIAYVNQNACTLFIPRGVYVYTNQIRLTNWLGTKIQGEHSHLSRLVYLGAGTNGFYIGGNGSAVDYQFETQIEDLWIGGTNTTQHALVLEDAEHAMIRNVWLGDCTGAVCLQRGCVSLQFDHVFMDGIEWTRTVQPSAGLLVVAGDYSSPNSCLYRNLYVSHVTGTGIDLSSCSQMTFDGGAVEFCGNGILAQTTTRNLEFRGMNLESCTNYGFNLQSHHHLLQNNYADGTTLVQGDQNMIIGGRYNQLTTGPNADETLVQTAVNVAGTGGFTEGTTNRPSIILSLWDAPSNTRITNYAKWDGKYVLDLLADKSRVGTNAFTATYGYANAEIGNILGFTTATGAYNQFVGDDGSLQVSIYNTGSPSATSPRWQVGKMNGAEAGANAGSDWATQRYADDGSLLGYGIFQYRATGALGVGKVPAEGTLDVEGTGAFNSGLEIEGDSILLHLNSTTDAEYSLNVTNRYNASETTTFANGTGSETGRWLTYAFGGHVLRLMPNSDSTNQWGKVGVGSPIDRPMTNLFSVGQDEEFHVDWDGNTTTTSLDVVGAGASYISLYNGVDTTTNRATIIGTGTSTNHGMTITITGDTPQLVMRSFMDHLPTNHFTMTPEKVRVGRVDFYPVSTVSLSQFYGTGGEFTGEVQGATVEGTTSIATPTLTVGGVTVTNSISVSDINGTAYDLNCEFSGGTAAIAAGAIATLSVREDMQLNGWQIVGNPSGSIVVDVQKSTYVDWPVFASIAGSEKPTITAATKGTDTSITSWTTNLTAGDIIRFVVDSASTCTNAFVRVYGVTR